MADSHRDLLRFELRSMAMLHRMSHAALLEQTVSELAFWQLRKDGSQFLEEVVLDVDLCGHPSAPDRMMDGNIRHPAAGAPAAAPCAAAHTVAAAMAAAQDAGGSRPPPQLVGRRARQEAASGPRGEAAGTRGTAPAVPPPAPPAADESDADSDGDVQEGARRRLAAWLALLALALLTLGGPAVAYLSTARPCWSDGSGRTGREHWAADWPLHAVSAPASLALAAWCVAVRGRSRPSVPLHAWTRRFAACAAAQTAAVLAQRLVDPGCHGAAGATWEGVCGALYNGAYAATLVVPYYLLLLKLRALGLRLLARAARAALVASAAGLATFVVARAAARALGALGRAGAGGGLLPAALAVAGGLGLLVAALGAAAVACCGAWGLLTAAAHAARWGGAKAAQPARWVGGTAVLVVASYVLTLAEGLLLLDALGPGGDEASWHAHAWGQAVNNGFNCLQVAFLSGLAGPRSLRRLAVQAFERINCCSAEELQGCYEEFLVYLDDAQIKWVRVGYLRRLAESGSIMVRCQDLPAAEAVIGRSGFPEGRGDPKHRFVLSHPWLSKRHPDPGGAKLQILVRQLDLLSALDEDAVFIDSRPSAAQHIASRVREPGAGRQLAEAW
ncbi:unnamed protein product [Prorocentrum cordatum]|uniref:Uncharacterized protein n=1 Tax=Prorocentrum cordatum TaxID=2364126 RepID=A0ABN9V8G9_9DINO|nr:unnamed protein product [Polarella glacialis]